MGLSLRELQLLNESEFSVEKARAELDALTTWFCEQPEQEHYLTVALQNTRKLPVSIGKEQKVFFVNDEMTVAWLPEDFQSEALGFVKSGRVLYAGRLVYPVMDVKGHVMGFCGWDNAIQPKYLDSTNQGYKAKMTTLYGMEKLSEYYKSNEPVYIVEGIVCCLYLRSKGFQALAVLGSHLSPYVISILRRFGRRLIVIPDNDVVGKEIGVINTSRPSGEGFVQQVKRALPKAIVVQSAIAKDVDDTRLLEEGKFEKQFLYELKQIAVCPFIGFEIVRIR
ncbi:MAG: hypothetical protein IJE43_19390 [Alphaproteobacteria bacterium]|nr:hypothetical protein [Alphaproteobacteria bacterium]